MAKIRQPVSINGVQCWITADSMQDFTDKALKLAGKHQQSAADRTEATKKHPFSDYAWNWFHTYSEPNIEKATATTYERQISLHLIPVLSNMAVEDMTTDDVQRVFNNMTGTKATKEKTKMVLNQILDAAVEDKLLISNPLKSKRVKITGKASKATETYSVEQMQYLVQHIGDIRDPLARAYLALQALHPLRLEEVLGLKGADIDTEKMQLHICRAVTHPDRNQPEVKETKTNSSNRSIDLVELAVQYLPETPAEQFVFGGEKPLSYTQVRSMCRRIKQDTGFSENITPIRFRTTVLTDLYAQTKDIKLAQEAAGHTTSAMTLRYYVKPRHGSGAAAKAITNAYVP